MTKVLEFKTVIIEHKCPKRKSEKLVSAAVDWSELHVDTYECEDCGSHTDYSVTIEKCNHCGKRHHIEMREIGTSTIDGKEIK